MMEFQLGDSKQGFIDALRFKAKAEELQKKYSKRWRYNERILNRIKKLHKKSRSIVIDWCRKFAKYVVIRACRNREGLIFEKLDYLWFNVLKISNSKILWKLSRFAYRKLINAVITKAIEYNVPIYFIEPKDTSRKCPRCRNELIYVHRLGYCSKCGFASDRDVIGAMNILLKLFEYVGRNGYSPNEGGMMNEIRQTSLNKNEGMTTYKTI